MTVVVDFESKGVRLSGVVLLAKCCYVIRGVSLTNKFKMLNVVFLNESITQPSIFLKSNERSVF